jgi:hypothetical protein
MNAAAPVAMPIPITIDHFYSEMIRFYRVVSNRWSRFKTSFSQIWKSSDS